MAPRKGLSFLHPPFGDGSQKGFFMAGWEEELAVLLSELGVKQEEPQAHLQLRKPLHGDVKRREQFTDALFWVKVVRATMMAG